jgi:Kef-type K+ transport system membrane component KefB
VAPLGVVFPFVLGFLYMKYAGHQRLDSIFLAAAMVTTSVGITARVLQDTNGLETSAARVILAAAVPDDILGMMVLALVTSLLAGPILYPPLAIVTAEAIGFSLLTIIFGSQIVARLHPAAAKFGTRNSAFALSIAACLGLSLASIYVGMAAIIGAFLAVSRVPGANGC